MKLVPKLLRYWIVSGLVVFLVHLLPHHFVVPDVLTATDGVCYGDGTGQCLDPEQQQQQQRQRQQQQQHLDPEYRKLTPSDLPLPQTFDKFDSNTSISVSGVEIRALSASILQQGHTQSLLATTTTNNNNKPVNATNRTSDDADALKRSELVVFPGLIPRPVVAELLELLRGDEDADRAGGFTTIALDKDPDSVDGMTSQEIFLDNDSLRKGGPSKSNPREHLDEGRKELRKKIRALTDYYSHEVLTSLLEKWYGTERCGREGRKCTPCYSLIRRYRAGERQSHAPHNDAHSFVTVVVSLTDYGNEYVGGLYVSAKNSERNYVRLNRGDAVAHQGDLHHGVRVLDQRDDGGPSERWSWIMWFRDSDTCDDHSMEWYDECADMGNPTCMYLHASHQSTAHEVLLWNQKASDAGHAQASVKLAYAYLKALPSNLKYDQKKAKELFELAIQSSNEPDGHYGMAMLYLAEARARVMGQPDNQSKQKASIQNIGSPLVLRAIAHLEEAARGGHVFAMFNLGICYCYGYAVKDGHRNFELASEWFEASGLPEGMFAKAMYLNAIGKEKEAQDFRERASVLGYGQPWRKPARERTGSGGSAGAKLNLKWPPLPGGEFPPEW